MSVGFFIDKKREPSPDEIAMALGTAQPAWDKLVATIRENYPVQEDFKFLYGKAYGWGLRFRVKSQMLANLYPGLGELTVQVNLREASVQSLLADEALNPPVRNAIRAAHPYPEGRWLFIHIASLDDLTSIDRLLALRQSER